MSPIRVWKKRLFSLTPPKLKIPNQVAISSVPIFFFLILFKFYFNSHVVIHPRPRISKSLRTVCRIDYFVPPTPCPPLLPFCSLPFLVSTYSFLYFHISVCMFLFPPPPSLPPSLFLLSRTYLFPERWNSSTFESWFPLWRKCIVWPLVFYSLDLRVNLNWLTSLLIRLSICRLQCKRGNRDGEKEKKI